MTGEESLHGELIARGYASDGISEDDGAAVAAIVGTAATADCGRINALSMKIPLFTSRLKKAGQGGAVPDFFCSWPRNQSPLLKLVTPCWDRDDG
jgi:hypothetical protein